MHKDQHVYSSNSLSTLGKSQSFPGLEPMLPKSQPYFSQHAKKFRFVITETIIVLPFNNWRAHL